METNDQPNSQPSSLALTFEVLYQRAIDGHSAPLPSRVLAPVPRAWLGVKNSESHLKNIEFIVDTGADISAISMYVAEENSISFNRRQRVGLKGVSRHPIKESFLNKIDLQIGTISCTIDCLIYDDGGKGGYSFLGRAGVLEKFSILFRNWHVYIGRVSDAQRS
jgi:hypothetical protein